MQERQEYLNKINHFEQLNQSKEYEYKIKEEQLKQKFQDAIRSTEDSYRDELDGLNQKIKEK